RLRAEGAAALMTALAHRVRRISFRARLQMFIALAVGVTVALASIAAYFTVHHQLYSEVDSALVTEMATVLAGPNGRLDPGTTEQNLRRYSDSVLQVIDGQGQVQFSPDLTGPGLPVAARQAAMVNTSRQYSIQTVQTPAGPYRVITEGGLISDQT